MSEVYDPKNALGSGAVHDALLLSAEASAAITRGAVVAMDGNGKIAEVATASLSRVVGVAFEAIASGAVGRYIYAGYCDYIKCAATSNIVATTDLVLRALDGGLCQGATQAEINTDGDLANHVFAKGLGVASGTTSLATGFIIPATIADKS